MVLYNILEKIIVIREKIWYSNRVRSFEMKKILGLLISLMLFCIPFSVKASKYVTENFEQVLTTEGIEHDLSQYQESEDKIPIYIFRGHGCAYCKAFLNFLYSIVPEYGKYFNLVSYEVWENEANATLFQQVSTFLNQSSDGVPFVVIGDQVFKGYTTAYDEQIKSAIKSLYDTKKRKRYDVFKEMNKKEPFQFSNNMLFVWITLLVGGCFYYQRRQYKILLEKLEKISLQEVKIEEKKEKKKKSQK